MYSHVDCTQVASLVPRVQTRQPLEHECHIYGECQTFVMTLMQEIMLLDAHFGKKGGEKKKKTGWVAQYMFV